MKGDRGGVGSPAIDDRSGPGALSRECDDCGATIVRTCSAYSPDDGVFVVSFSPPDPEEPDPDFDTPIAERDLSRGHVDADEPPDWEEYGPEHGSPSDHPELERFEVSACSLSCLQRFVRERDLWAIARGEAEP